MEPYIASSSNFRKKPLSAAERAKIKRSYAKVPKIAEESSKHHETIDIPEAEELLASLEKVSNYSGQALTSE